MTEREVGGFDMRQAGVCEVVVGQCRTRVVNTKQLEGKNEGREEEDR